MAKNKRFPSPANQKKPTAESEKAKASGAQDQDSSAPLAAVEGHSQKTVAVEYHKDNHHVLGIGAHALRKGTNHISHQVWEAAKQTPAVKAMLAAGHLSEHSAEQPEKKEDPAAGQGDGAPADDEDLDDDQNDADDGQEDELEAK